MRSIRFLLCALTLALATPTIGLAQSSDEPPAERLVSEDGRLQSVDAYGNPLFDASGNPIWEKTPEERAAQLFTDAMNASQGLAPGSTAWQFSVVPPLREALDLNPAFHEARFNLGMIYLRVNDLEGAILELEKIVLEQKDNLEARIGLGIAYERVGRLSDAEMLYARGLADTPENVDLLNGQARVLLKRGRPADAERAAKAVLGINSNSIDAFNTLGLAYLELGRFETARFVFQKAKSLPGGNQSGTLEANLGLVYWRMGQEFRAEAAFQSALELDPNHAGARVNLAHLRLGNLDYAGARELLEPAYQQLKGNEVVQLSYAVSLRGTGDYERAQQIYEEIASDVDSELRDDALLNLGILQGDFLKDYPAALDTFNEYIAVRESMGQPVGEEDLVRDYIKEMEKLERKKQRRLQRDRDAAAEEAAKPPEPPPEEPAVEEPAPEEAAPEASPPEPTEPAPAADEPVPEEAAP